MDDSLWLSERPIINERRQIMDDADIVKLFFERSEDAVTQTGIKYGKWLRGISFSVLRQSEDADECVNDTYLHAWNAIPPARPQTLSAYLGKIVRNLSIDRLRRREAEKRQSEYTVCLDELEWCISGGDSPDDMLGERELRETVNRFLRGLSKKRRLVFIARYWNLLSCTEIAEKLGMTDGSVRTSLHRTREELKGYLKKEGYEI